MRDTKKKEQEIKTYIDDQEYVANKYLMKCFSVTMFVYTIAFILNLLNIFVIDQSLMWKGYVLSMIIYILVYVVSKKISLSDGRTKYFYLPLWEYLLPTMLYWFPYCHFCMPLYIHPKRQYILFIA